MQSGIPTNHLQPSPPWKVGFFWSWSLCALSQASPKAVAVHGPSLSSVNRCEEAKNCKAGNGHLVQWAWSFKFISNAPPCFVFASTNLLSPHKNVYLSLKPIQTICLSDLTWQQLYSIWAGLSDIMLPEFPVYFSCCLQSCHAGLGCSRQTSPVQPTGTIQGRLKATRSGNADSAFKMLPMK